MLTPRFSLTQTDNEVTVSVRAPYCSLRDLDISIEENIFIFLCKPYYLRLHLPGDIVEDEECKSSFDVDSGEFSFTVKKATQGEHFADLDLVTKLLCPKNIEVESSNQEKIIVLSNEGGTPGEDFEVPSIDDGARFGFALRGNKHFNYISAEFSEVLEVDPRVVDLEERHKLRLIQEQQDFSKDHYIYDFMEVASIKEIIAMNTPYSKLTADQISFTEKELDFLKDLTNIHHNLTNLETTIANLGLIDILYAYCYDRRTTDFEGSVESGWTIIKLAASLGWLDSFTNIKETLVSNFRRSLIYPLYRNFDLSQKIFEDLKVLLSQGQKYIIKCLIEIYYIFLTGDCCRYILNNLFIRNYVTYVMQFDKIKWGELIESINKITITKGDLGLNLAHVEGSVFDLELGLGNLNLRGDDSDDGSDSYVNSSSEMEVGDSSSDSNSTQ